MKSESKYDLLRKILLSPLLMVASRQNGNHPATIREAGTTELQGDHELDPRTSDRDPDVTGFSADLPQTAGQPDTNTAQSIEELVRPGHLVLTDDGRLGRVSRVIKAPESSHHSELELHGENGAKSIHSLRELRFIYCFDPDGHESAA